MVQAYCTHEQFEKALTIYKEMIQHRIEPDEFTYSIILKALAEISNLREGQIIHAQLKVTNNNFFFLAFTYFLF